MQSSIQPAAQGRISPTSELSINVKTRKAQNSLKQEVRRQVQSFQYFTISFVVDHYQQPCEKDRFGHFHMLTVLELSCCLFCLEILTKQSINSNMRLSTHCSRRKSSFSLELDFIRRLCPMRCPRPIRTFPSHLEEYSRF